jgi:hypothetical protein
MMVVVRPWKLPAATMMLARPSATPLTRYPQALATLMPDSTASAPVFIGSTMSLPLNLASAVTNGPSWSLWNARLVRVMRPSCARAASSSTGLEWPKLTAEYAARQSR